MWHLLKSIAAAWWTILKAGPAILDARRKIQRRERLIAQHRAKDPGDNFAA